MRLLLYLAELLAAIGVVWVGVKAAGGALRRRRERRELEEARWKRRLVPLPDGRVRVEVAKRGVENAIPVETLDPQQEGFDVARFEAEARADDLALSLNASDGG